MFWKIPLFFWMVLLMLTQDDFLNGRKVDPRLGLVLYLLSLYLLGYLIFGVL